MEQHIICYGSSIGTHIVSILRKVQRFGNLNYFGNGHVSDVCCAQNMCVIPIGVLIDVYRIEA
jgi:hypothetical protein